MTARNEASQRPSRHYKRSAFEPAEVLLGAGEQGSVPLKRPLSTSMGSAFVITRALSGVLWLVVFGLNWESDIASVFGLTADQSLFALLLVLVLGSIGEIVLLVLGFLIWRGSNLARVLVMAGLTLSILTAAGGYFAYGEQITLTTTLFTLSLDILVLLALSSRDARIWSRYRISTRKAARVSARAKRD